MNAKILCLVLAGGEGSRLFPLTYRRAKPILPYGGKYRIIDFVLSNVVNSGIKDIGVLAQHEPDSLIKHLGFAWRFDREFCRVDTLFPHRYAEQYTSPGDAVYKRLDYVVDKNPDYVVIVPGDYVSLINYRKIVQFHIDSGAQMTIAATNVNQREAHKFGMMEVDDSHRVTRYIEKPKEDVGTTLASMGIYVFDLDVLVRRLMMEAERNADISFTYEMIPRMVEEREVCAYPFKGYWRDVGTIESYFEANLELIKIMPELNIYNTKNPIRSRMRFGPPPKICEYGSVKNCILTDANLIDGHVERCIIFPQVRVDKGTEIYDSLIMPNNHIGSNAVIRNAIIDTVSRATLDDEHPTIGRNCFIGGDGQGRPNEKNPELLNSGVTVIGMESEVPEGARIGRNCLVMPGCLASDFDGRMVMEDGETLYPREERL